MEKLLEKNSRKDQRDVMEHSLYYLPQNTQAWYAWGQEQCWGPAEKDGQLVCGHPPLRGALGLN